MPYNVITFYDEDPYWRVGSKQDSDTFDAAETEAVKTSHACVTAVVEASHDALYHQDKVKEFDAAPPEVIYFQGKKYTRSE